MSFDLPKGWEHLDEGFSIKFHNTYPDGTDVIIEIKKSSNYEIWSSSEHRCSGPNINKESEHTDKEAAIEAAIKEMKGWNEYIVNNI